MESAVLLLVLLILLTASGVIYNNYYVDPNGLNMTDGLDSNIKIRDSLVRNKIEQDAIGDDLTLSALKSGNYITPTEFSVGMIPVTPENPLKYANNCITNVLYPINGLGVEYGTKMPEQAPCYEFIQAP